MPSYLHPGVYVEEIPSGARPIEGVATSTAAFVGVTQRNSRQSDPVLIGNMNDYLDLFGPILTSSDAMGLAVQAFYQNGGKAAYICSLSTDSDTATRDFGDLTVDAKGDGPWGNHLYIRITRVGADDFDMEVGARNEDGTFYTLESAYEKLSLDPTDDMYAEGVVNEASSLIEVSVGGVTLPTVTDNDGDGDGNDDGLALEHGEQTAPSNTDYSTFYEETLRKYRDVSIIVLPGENWAADGSGNPIIDATRSHCEKEKNRVVILDPPSTLELKTSNTVSDMSLPTSTYTVLYYPWVGMSNPLYHRDRNPNAAATVNVAPSAIAAGMWAKIDGKRGVWKAPAGVETS